MTKNTASKTNEIAASVSIVDGKLILSLPNAKMPVVWQTNLVNAQSCSFTIQEDKKEKTFVLILKAQEGEVDEIAHFGKKQTSVDILMEISNVLQNSHGKIAPVANITSNNNAPIYAPKPQNKKNDNKIGAILAFALIILLLLIWFISASNNINNFEGGFRNAESRNDTRESSGVTMSADDFLNNR